MKQLSGFLILLLFSLFSCREQTKKINTHAITIVEAHGYTVPADSVKQPVVVPAGIPEVVKITAPAVVLTNTNIVIAGSPEMINGGTPAMYTPGRDTFLLPQIIPAIDSPFVAGIPEVVPAKDAAIKDHDPDNFSSFGKLQGLKQDVIRCMLQDKKGNLWFGTDGGASKYDGKSFTHLTQKEGFSSSVIRCMLEDKAGNIWFGSSNGLSKYDGKSITNFSEREGLINNFVRCMVEDEAGNIWIGTDGGLSKYDGKSFTNFSKKQGLPDIMIWSLLVDKKGDLWMGTDVSGVCKYDGKSFIHFSEKQGFLSPTVWCMMEDKAGNIWMGSDNGVTEYDGKSFRQYTEKDGLSGNVVRSIMQDSRGNFWFGTDGDGVSRYEVNAASDEKARFTHYSEAQGLSDNIVRSMLEDNRGNLWFGTYGGVNKYDGRSFTHFTVKEGLSNSVVLSILEDKKGNLWLGTNGGGINKYDRNSRTDGKATFTQYTEKEGIAGSIVYAMLQDKKENLWFGTQQGVYKYDGKSFSRFTVKQGLSDNGVLSIAEDRQGNLWFGTNGSGVDKYDGQTVTYFTKEQGLSEDAVVSVLQDKKGNMWFGTIGGGVDKYDGKSFTHYTKKEGLSGNVVVSILEDKSGSLWFGTSDGGVSKYDEQNGKATFTCITEKEGLSSNSVLSMLEDKKGNLWLGTRFGLSKLSPGKKEKLLLYAANTNASQEEQVFFKNYFYEDGFLGIGVNGGKTICEDKAGTIWIAANDRLTAVYPESDFPDTTAPNIELTSIELYNENIPWLELDHKKDSTLTLGNGVHAGNFEFNGTSNWYGLPQELSLAYTNNYLTFNFTGITQKQSKKVKYQYKLEGIDDNWSAITGKAEAPYGNLPHGNYTFMVKAMNSEGYWSKPLEYHFTIRPPFWQTWWFRVFSGMLIVAAVWFYIKSRERKLLAEKEKLERTVEERTAEVVEEKKIVEEQKHLIEEKHKEITDSINYAERIQRSFIATKEILDANLPDYFVLFKPKDVVSGDFYWAHKPDNGNFILVTADSTGHGVPGAIMSLLNITSLEKAVEHYHYPNEILNATRKTIIERLKKDGSEQGGKDGMDASLTMYDFKNKKLFVAAANNPVWIVRNNNVIEIKPDKMPVGKHDKDTVSFAQQEIDLQNGDVIYTLTDGFPDQFGGEKGKKFMSKNLRELLIANAYLPMQEQKLLLENTFKNWVSSLEQVDDVTIIGVRI